MAKQKQSMTDSGASSPRPMSAAQHKHFQEIVGHTLDNSARAGHGGHALGKAGPGNTGHVMPPSDAHLQKGAYLPQAALNTATKDGGPSFDDNQKAASDYGTVDKTGD